MSSSDALIALKLAKAILPKVPVVIRTTILHTAGLTPTAAKWDLKLELVIAVIRAFINGPPSPISRVQNLTLRDPGIKGRLWIAKVVMDTDTAGGYNGSGLVHLLERAITGLKEANDMTTEFVMPDLRPIEAEWTGYRSGVKSDAARPQLSEGEHYNKMMDEVSSDVTVLYLHGGAYYLFDPALIRGTVARLARLTKGRCLSVRYRLAPQNPFPAALLDAFLAYLYLLAPPPGSYHAPVAPETIVFAGDSAGGGLSFALLQLILELRRQGLHRMTWHGHSIELKVPGGVAGNSPWLDVTRCMPSIVENAVWDYLPPPRERGINEHFPKDDIWPAKPPRGDLYCNLDQLCHPLVSPLAAKDWRGSCPVWLGCGQEMLFDEDAQFAAHLARQDVIVQWDQFEAMPHCFALIFPADANGSLYFNCWASFINEAVSSAAGAHATMRTGGRGFQARSLKMSKVNVPGLAGTWTHDKVLARMRNAQLRRIKGEENETLIMPKA